jgi:hypothetical protein
LQGKRLSILKENEPREQGTQHAGSRNTTEGLVLANQSNQHLFIDLTFDRRKTLNLKPESKTKELDVADPFPPRYQTNYWSIYNAIDLAYRNDEPEKALKLFMKLREEGELHSGAYSLHLRCYRKLRDKLFRKRELRDAFTISENLLREDKLEVTDNDRRKHVKIAESIGIKVPDDIVMKIASAAITRRPANKERQFIRIKSSRGWKITETSIRVEGEKGRKQGGCGLITDYGTLAIVPRGIGRFGAPDARATFSFHSISGECTAGEFPSVVYRIGWNPYSRAFVTMSPELMIDVWRLPNEPVCQLHLPMTEPEGSGTDKYHVRCVATSGDGSKFLYTRVGQAVLLDSTPKEIWIAQTPVRPGMIREIESGVSGSPEDWIYAAALNPAGTRVLLGCYSGRIFELDGSGQILRTMNFGEPVIGLVPLEHHLIVQSHTRIMALVGKEVRGMIAREPGSSLTYYTGGVILRKNKSLRVFDRDLRSLGEIEALETLEAFWRTNKTLNIETKNAVTQIENFF